MILIFAVMLTFLLMVVIVTDVTRFIIPNWLVGLVLVLYPLLLLIAPEAREYWQSALLVALGTFAVGFPLFLLRAMGGGDVKLLAALALFVGKDTFLLFFIYVTFLGGGLALILLLARPAVAFLFSRLTTPPAIPRVLTIGEPVPYGVAIAIGFVLVLWMGKLPGLML